MPDSERISAFLFYGGSPDKSGPESTTYNLQSSMYNEEILNAVFRKDFGISLVTKPLSRVIGITG